jgi:hypothetical protein
MGPLLAERGRHHRAGVPIATLGNLIEHGERQFVQFVFGKQVEIHQSAAGSDGVNDPLLVFAPYRRVTFCRQLKAPVGHNRPG